MCILMVVHWATKPSGSLSLDEFERHERAAVLRGNREQSSQGMISHTNSARLGFWLKEGLPDEFTPKIVWLMAWPESGETYIAETIQRVSNHSTATNYGERVTLPGYYSIPIYPLHSEGPFWEGLAGQFGNKIRLLPERNVLTMTHCSFKCFFDCPPKQYYDESETLFSKACRTTTAQVVVPSDSNNNDNQITAQYYSMDRVTKAIHVIRNPFHNVIERFIQEREKHHRKEKNEGDAADDEEENHHSKSRSDEENTQFLEEYPNLPKKGFQKWCEMMDHKYEKEDAKVYSKSHWTLAKKSLCHAEFYKYVQWHNHAFATTKHMTDIKIVYYEDFYNDSLFEHTIQGIVDMLELERVDKPYDFSAPHDYTRYYTLEMRNNIRKFVKALASKETWEHLKHYFEPGAIEA